MSDESDKKLFVKIVNVDYYLTKPTSELKDPCYSGFRSLPIYSVPVIRIFGPTSEGVKTCAHIHGVFPYIFIPNWNNKIEEKDLYQFATNLDRVINTSFANSSSKTTHVYRISKVSGKPFYGYYESEKQFLKIEFYNPAMVKRAIDLLQNGAVYNMSFQPYEAHVPYILQFFIDNNLYGMSYIILSSYSVRNEDIKNFREDVGAINSTYCNIPKQSYCALEVDVSVCDIINAYQTSDDMPNNPGLAFIWEEEKKRRRCQRRVSQITPNISQIRPEREFTRTELYFKTKLAENLNALKITDSDSLVDISQGWESNSSYEELNTQSRSILSLLEKLVNPGDVDKKDISPASSPSVVCSDEEGEVASNLSFICSQPLLKLPAENDSILGNDFSDNEVDDNDHLTLSRSLVHKGLERSFSSDNSDTEQFGVIPQLDGADGISPPRSRSRKNTAANKDTKKAEARGKRTYNLRSKKKETNSNIENDDPKKNWKNEGKTSPKKQYPQLQIDTQKSPKSNGVQRSAITTEQSPRSVIAAVEMLGTANVFDSLRSPSVTGFRNAPGDECRKSESKRPYPQLEVNIKKSPRTVSKSEEKEAKTRKVASIRLKKRKINFDDSESKSNASDSFDMSLMTARWKRQRVKENKDTKDGSSSCTEKSGSLENFRYNFTNDLKTLVPHFPENEADNASICRNSMHTVESDVNSQKYSLGIRFNSDDLDHRVLLESLFLKEPVVRLQRITDIDAFKIANDISVGSAKPDEKVTLTNMETMAYNNNEKKTCIVENFTISKADVEDVGSLDCLRNAFTLSTNSTREDKNSVTNDVVTRRSKRNMVRVVKKTRTDLNENKSNVPKEVESSINSWECVNELKQNKNSLKRKRLGMRMNVKNKNNVCDGNKSSEILPCDIKKNPSLVFSETTVSSSNMQNSTDKKEFVENIRCNETDKRDKAAEESLSSKLNLQFLDVKFELKEEAATQSEEKIFDCNKKICCYTEMIEVADVSNLIFTPKSESASDTNYDPSEMETIICSNNTNEDEKLTELNLRIPGATENKSQKSEFYAGVIPNKKIVVTCVDTRNIVASTFNESVAKLEYQCSEGSNTNYDPVEIETIVCCRNTDDNEKLTELNLRIPEAYSVVDKVVETIINNMNSSNTLCLGSPGQLLDVKSELLYSKKACSNYSADVQTVICSGNTDENENYSDINLRVPGTSANTIDSDVSKNENNSYLASTLPINIKKSESQYTEMAVSNYNCADVQTIIYSGNTNKQENFSDINLRIPEMNTDTSGSTVPKNEKKSFVTSNLQVIDTKKLESQYSENVRTNCDSAELRTIICFGNTDDENFSELNLRLPAANTNVGGIKGGTTNKKIFRPASDLQALDLKSESQSSKNQDVYYEPAQLRSVICSGNTNNEKRFRKVDLRVSGSNVSASDQKIGKNIIDDSIVFRNNESLVLGCSIKENAFELNSVRCSLDGQGTHFNGLNLRIPGTQTITNGEEVKTQEPELFSPPSLIIPCVKDLIPTSKAMSTKNILSSDTGKTNLDVNIAKYNVPILQNDNDVSTSVNGVQNSQDVELFSQPHSHAASQKSDGSVEGVYRSSCSDENHAKHDDSVCRMYNLNSDDDELFCELNLRTTVTQSPKIADVKCAISPKTEAVARSNVARRNENIEGDEECLPDRVPKNTNLSRLTSKSDFDFNNSIWDTIEDESVDEEGIKSFYDESTASVDVTLFRSRKSDDEKSSPILKFSSENDKELFEDHTDAEKSSPIAKTLTPQSDENEIMSFYDCESPIGSIVLLNDEKLSDADSDTCPQNKNYSNSENHSVTRSVSSADRSPIFMGRSKNVLHSTPQQQGKPKKSPSPTYTPILKKLMLKKFTGNNKMSRKRISSQRFQSEPFLTNIKEEEVLECDAKDTSVSLPMNISNEKIGETKMQNSNRSSCSGASGQIDITLGNTYGFRMDLENLQDVKANVQYQYITVMSLEIFAETRQDLNPDPEFDPICCLFYSVFHDAPNTSKLTSGVIIVDNGLSRLDAQRFTCEKLFVENETELFDLWTALVRKWDPDIFIGYEVEMLSWGYYIQRGQYLKRSCDVELSRVKDMKTKEFKEKTINDDSDYSSEFKVVGRIILNVWRLMRHEIALQSYSFENIIFHVLHQRVSQHSFQSLTEWWKNPLRRWIVIDYYLFRTENSILLLDQLDFFGRTSELARLFGIQFYEVLSRGSQFRVESMMLRLAKTQNFVAVSPNPRQRAAMRAPESLPLIMEPESKFYTDPVIVLDFQSLYPSIIIAYNYCFSTCLGRVQHLGKDEVFNFGCIQHAVPTDLLLNLESSLNFSPCGVAFVNKTVRKGILPSMLEEILETRLMVKKSMKENKNNTILQRVLHARQLGLKLIANVTYGYTSANFSGRMPCIEIGDSVVSKGRETLERAIELVSSTEKWGARVIYGDTDSIFVIVPNRTKEEAFQIGNEIVEAVTNDNPKPVKLKLEKVYYPCILQTKKRYVGYMYESADQKEPIYDAKGIETVRRDGCPAVCKILEKSLKLLFESENVDIVKRYVQRQFSKLISGRLSIQELTFAREYRGMHNYRPAACVPALQLARQALLKDRRSEPRVKERVRYVIVAGPPGVPLIRLVRTPQQFLENPGSVINAEYYITRAIIPALERCFLLMNVNVQSWYAELPRKQKLYLPIENDFRNRTYKKKIISHYFASSKCVVCQRLALSGVCKQCEKNPQQLAIILGGMINTWQRRHNYISKICRSCCGKNDLIECTSLDCPIFYSYHQTKKDMEQVPYIEELQHKYLCFQNANKLLKSN